MEYVRVQGVEVPAIGLGTWRLTGDACRRTVTDALELGYRHVDTAQVYGNERQVGAGIADADVDREDVFLTTKLSGGNRGYDDVLRSVDESLSKLDTSYLDLLLIHFPRPGVPLGETLAAMNELVDAGKVEHIGVSNFSIERLQRARDLSDAPIFTDQVQYHPYWPQTRLLDYCNIHGVMLTAYSPLAQGEVLSDPVLEEIGDRYGKSPAQVALRWLVQQEGVCTIPKATSREHLEANLQVFDFELSAEEMARIRRPSKLKAARGFLRQSLPL
ncbi:aldo/keto reductase [Natronomonas sp. EA1]|uniref:aldo/keto reductase n=1 Tax=Natronomonas sp. EA1 TaxID=3421655 RepID=UPI003EBFD7EC